MDAKRKTALSAGLLIAKMLREEDPEGKVIGGIIPVMASEEEKLPYCVYGLKSIETRPDKTPGAAVTANYEIRAYSETYAENIESAEAICRAMDFSQLDEREWGLSLRHCRLVDAQSGYEADSFVTVMEFTMKI